MESNLRTLQLKELDILKEIKRICDKYNIRYYLSGGTLLGAVRHQGFIPWDDDIDVTMPIKDYLHFLDIAQKELNHKFFLQNYRTDSNEHNGYTKIRMNDTAMILPNHKKWKIHQGIWVDIFPLITVKNEKDLKWRRLALSISNFFQMDSYVLDNEEEFKELLKFAYYPWRAFLRIPMPFRMKLHDWFLQYAYREVDAQYLSEAWGTLTNKHEKNIIEGEKRLQFEDDMFSVFGDYEQYLTITYDDYMQLPPIEERRGHGNLIINTEKSYMDFL